MVLLWSDRALADLGGLRSFYAGKDPSLEGRALQRIFDSVELILRYPRVGTIYKGMRRRRVGGTPFFVFFREIADRIEIVRVLHIRSDWQSLL